MKLSKQQRQQVREMFGGKFRAQQSVYLIEPHEPSAEPLEVLVSDEDLEAAR